MSETIEADIKKYTEQLAKDPKSRAFVPLADTYRKLGRYEEAISVAQEGLKYHPTYVGGKMSLARAYFEYGDLEPAREVLEGIIRFAPDNLMANRILSEVYVQEGNSEAAIPILRRLLAMEPNDERAAQQLASLEQQSENPSTPIEGEKSPNSMKGTEGPIPESANEKRPEPDAMTLTPTIAELYRNQGHLEKSLEVYQTLQMKDKIAEIQDQIAQLRTRSDSGDSNESKSFLNMLLHRIQERRRKSI